VKINVQVVQVTSFFGPDYLCRTFSGDVQGYQPLLETSALTQVLGCPFNGTHWNVPCFTKLYNINPGRCASARVRRDANHELRAGGNLSPVIVPNLDPYQKHVQGPGRSKNGAP
jgi:hypothetical protein